MDPFKLKKNIGTFPGNIPSETIFTVEIEFDGNKLSITGEGDGHGGQCQDLLLDPRLQTRWTTTDLLTLHGIWNNYHLNAMVPECPHQRELGWNRYPINPDLPTSAYIEHKGMPTWNMLGWLTEKEHPFGILSRACPICGYRYGNEWLSKTVPDYILMLLKHLPLYGRLLEDVLKEELRGSQNGN